MLLTSIRNPGDYKAIKFSNKYDYPFISIHFLELGMSTLPSSFKIVSDNTPLNYTLVDVQDFQGKVQMPSKDELGNEMEVKSYCAKKTRSKVFL